jgi:hypothetical protein
MATSGSSQMMDKFFNLGNKATRGDPVRKAYFDYCLYWVVFLTFVFLSINYIYNYFAGNGSMGSLGWGIVVGIFSWFNYWALISFRMAYLNMKKFYDKPKDVEKIEEDKDEFEGLFDPEEDED